MVSTGRLMPAGSQTREWVDCSGRRTTARQPLSDGRWDQIDRSSGIQSNYGLAICSRSCMLPTDRPGTTQHAGRLLKLIYTVAISCWAAPYVDG